MLLNFQILQQILEKFKKIILNVFINVCEYSYCQKYLNLHSIRVYCVVRCTPKDNFIIFICIIFQHN